MVRAQAVALLLLTSWVPGGCAVFEEENRHTLNAMDEHLTPESEAMRWTLAPLALPVGLVGATADIVLVHPARVIDDAWGDTTELLWTSRGESRFRRAVMLPLVTVATPFVFIGDWLWRAAFAVPPREDEESS